MSVACASFPCKRFTSLWSTWRVAALAATWSVTSCPWTCWLVTLPKRESVAMASLKSALRTWMTMLPDTGDDRAVPPAVDELSTYPPSAPANPVMFVNVALRESWPIRMSIVALRTIWGAIGNVGTRGRAEPLAEAAPWEAPASPDAGANTDGLAGRAAPAEASGALVGPCKAVVGGPPWSVCELGELALDPTDPPSRWRPTAVPVTRMMTETTAMTILLGALDTVASLDDDPGAQVDKPVRLDPAPL
jgi:hypothetical protein